jgi:hypothetical protein
VFSAVVMAVGSETFPVVAVLSMLSGCAQFVSAWLLLCPAGVVGYYGADDVPGDNMIGPIMHDEEVFATKEVTCVGQVRFTLPIIKGGKGRWNCRCICCHCAVFPHYRILSPHSGTLRTC